jgi:glycosyltransferase involved in cell wall biosynthesis
LERELTTLIEKKDLGKYVFLAGGKPHSEIPLWINACDVFVLPSLNEGNPTVMFEALGCGKPFVGTKVGGVPEIISSEEYGILVNPADSHDLADKILLALEREWDTAKILTYAEQFTWDTIAKEIVGIYSNVVR